MANLINTAIRNAHLATVDRRTTLRWLAAATAAGQLAACGEKFSGLAWPEPPPITGKGYGKDPNLAKPTAPWPLTLTSQELATTRTLVDLILPADGDAPSASQVGVEAFIDEWVSAPYPDQQKQRTLIIPGLAWLDAEAKTRSGKTFDKAKPDIQKAILDDVAFKDRVKPGLEKPAEFFVRMRSLTLGAYYTTPQGWKQIGYPGNDPFIGEYPGPTPEAIEHIRGVLDSMGLKLVFPETGKL